MLLPSDRKGGITVTELPGSTVAHLWGEVDVMLRDEASAALASVLTRDLPVVLDTSRVEFIDSTGMAFLIQCATLAREQGLAVSLPDPPETIRQMVQLLRLEEVFAERPMTA